MLQADQVTVRYEGKTAVDQISFVLEEGQWLMLAGPNGAGKSSLIRAIAQTIPWEGRMTLNGASLRGMKPAERAGLIGVLSQQHSMEYDYTVEEIVRLGRYAYRRGFLRGEDEIGEEMVSRALRWTGMEDFRNASMMNLSGGETQRAFLAQVFAQDPKLLILDEPTNHLDLKYQQQMMDLVAEWLKQPGRAVISVMHDLSLAQKYGTHALLMNQGKEISFGPASEALTREKLEEVYEMDVYGWMREMLSTWE